MFGIVLHLEDYGCMTIQRTVIFCVNSGFQSLTWLIDLQKNLAHSRAHHLPRY